MGIFFGIVFIVWFVSGMVFMYVGMPHLSPRERLGHLKPLDLSTVTLSPAEAAKKTELDPKRFRVEMFYDGRPIYRFGNTKVYADTGDLVGGADALKAVDILKKRRRYSPEFDDASSRIAPPASPHAAISKIHLATSQPETNATGGSHPILNFST